MRYRILAIPLLAAALTAPPTAQADNQLDLNQLLLGTTVIRGPADKPWIVRKVCVDGQAVLIFSDSPGVTIDGAAPSFRKGKPETCQVKLTAPSSTPTPASSEPAA